MTPPGSTPLDRSAVVVDKPAGPTSHEVSTWVRDILDVDKAAHTGTLDPRVTGCLPVLLGNSARVSGVLSGAPKEYVFVLELHETVSREDVEDVLEEFTGEVLQRPPRVGSAARDLRTREIHALDLLDHDGSRWLCRVGCESGTYVRKLCHDLGLALGVGGHMAELRRIRSGGFHVDDGVYLQTLVDAVAAAEYGDPTALDDLLTPVEEALADLPRVDVHDEVRDTVAHGSPVYAPGVVSVSPEAEDGDAVAVFTESGVAVCVGELVDDFGEGGEVVQPSHVLVDPE